MLYVTIFSVANHHVESWICRGQKTWLLFIQGNLTDQQYMDTDTVKPVVVTFACQQNSIFKILYTGKFLSKQCWDIILAPIQSRPDLSSNKEYVVHPTHIHPNVDICPLCVRHLWKKEKIPMVQINSIENGRFSAGTH